jgi:ABC-type phosphonate transport system ATPase subunit
MDDIPGRLIGKKIGEAALEYATSYFTGGGGQDTIYENKLFPNPTDCVMQVEVPTKEYVVVALYSTDGRLILSKRLVLKEGKVVEFGETEALIAHPKQAYTKQLFTAAEMT